MGHATFDHYSLMLRTLKTYNITLDCSPDHAVMNDCETYERSITFSSSPGTLWARVVPKRMRRSQRKESIRVLHAFKEVGSKVAK